MSLPLCLRCLACMPCLGGDVRLPQPASVLPCSACQSAHSRRGAAGPVPAPPCSRHQFVQALYLIDCTKRGMPVPAALPPGPFPPVAGGGHLGMVRGGRARRASLAQPPGRPACCPHASPVPLQGAPSDIYSGLAVPDMVPRAVYQPAPVPPQPFASQVPGLPRDRVTALDAADQLRLEGEREAALKAEEEQRKVGSGRGGVRRWRQGRGPLLASPAVPCAPALAASLPSPRCPLSHAQAEEERAAAAAKKDFFTRALADMRLVQSRVTRAVVEAQQRCVAVAALGSPPGCGAQRWLASPASPLPHTTASRAKHASAHLLLPCPQV